MADAASKPRVAEGSVVSFVFGKHRPLPLKRPNASVRETCSSFPKTPWNTSRYRLESLPWTVSCDSTGPVAVKRASPFAEAYADRNLCKNVDASGFRESLTILRYTQVRKRHSTRRKRT